MTLSKFVENSVHELGKSLNDKNKNEVLAKIRNMIKTRSPSYRSQTVNFSLSKGIMKKYTNDYDFLKKIKPDQKIINKVLSDDIKQRDSKKLIYVSMDSLNKILNYNQSDDLFELAMFLLLSSGRRTSELMASKFKNVKRENQITIDNVIKRTDKCQNLTFEPLVKKTIFIKNIKKFKKKYKYSNKDTFQRTLHRHIKANIGQEYYPHLLRKIYANYMYRFRNTEKLAINPFIQNALLQQSITSSMYYTGVKFDFDSDFIKKKKFSKK